MKKPLLLTIIICLSIVAYAGPVDLEQAKQNALRFITDKQPAMARGKKIMTMTTACQTESYYVFNVGESQGYVIASGDDRTPGVLGYADKGSFDIETIPDNMKAWLQGYADQMSITRATPATTSELGRPVAPMISSLWGQDAPYYNKCPKLYDTPCVTGCVATAMAQVMNYHRYPAQTIQEIPSFTTTSAKIKVDAIPVTSIDWNNIIDSYSYNATTAQNNAVATLMQLCGASILMDYTNYGSGASSEAVAPALRHYFGYSNTVKNIQRNDYSADEWNRIIYAEMISGRPVIYGGQSSAGGHEFVIDGYDGNGYFHVNWGWKGMDDGYFLLSALNPPNNNGIGASGSADGYNMSQDANIGIQPKGASEPTILTDYLNVATFVPMAESCDKMAAGMDFHVSLQFSVSNYGIPNSYDFGALIYTTDYKQVDAGQMFNADFKYGTGYTGSNTIQFGKSLPDGQYYMIAANRPTGTTEWTPCENAWQNGILVTISGKKMTLVAQEIPNPNLPTSEPDQGGTEQPVQPVVIMLSGQMSIGGQFYQGGEVKLSVIITNYGTDYDGHLYMMLDGQAAGSSDFKLEAEKSAEWTNTLKNVLAGEHKIVITTDSEGKNIVAEGEFAVALYPEASLEMKINATNVENGRTEENRINLSVDIRNTGTDTYDNKVLLQLYNLTAPGKPVYTEEKTCRIEKGGTATMTFNCEDLDFDQSYYARTLYHSGNEWVRAAQSENIHVRKPEVAVQITMFTVEDMIFNGTLEKGEDIEMQLFVRNEGNMSNGKLYIWENDGKPTALDVNIPPGALGVCKYQFKADKAGVWNFKVTRDAEGTDVAINQNIIIGNSTESQLAIGVSVSDLERDYDYGEKYWLGSHEVTLNISVENTNTEVYDDMILICLYQTLTDIDDEWGDCVATDSMTCHLDPNQEGFGTISFRNLKDGEEYFFITYYRSRNEWIRATESDAFTLWLADDMTGHNFQQAGNVTFDGNFLVGSPITAHIPLINKGKERKGTIYYQTTGKDQNIKPIYLDIEPGGTATYDVVFYPAQKGTLYFDVASSKNDYRYWAKDDWIDSYEMEIGPEPEPTLEVDIKVDDLVENELGKEKVKYEISIKNVGQTPFNREGSVRIHKEGHGNKSSKNDVIVNNSILCQLNPTDSDSWEFIYDELEDGKSYYISYYYWWYDGWRQAAKSPVFTVNKFKPVTKFDVDNMTFQGSMLTFEPVSTEMTITNRGNVNDGIVYVFVDDILSSMARINSLESGKTAKYTAKFTPRTAGVKTVKITSDAEGRTVLATQDITIGEKNSEAHLTGEASYENVDMSTQIVSDTRLNLLIDVANTDAIDYTGELKVVATTDGEAERTYEKPLTLEAGKNRAISFIIGDLTYQVPYTITVYYTSLGHDKELTDPVTLTLNGVASAMEGRQVDTNGQVEIYNTSGLFIGKIPQDEVREKLATLPKGIYIVGGKKIVKK